jgi:trans-aconitate 2-methyltransferase
MDDWKPGLYLKFEKQRTQPAVDLAARIGIGAPKRIIDIGCGPGNSTAVLRSRWPDADITGLDSSPAMIKQATKSDNGTTWICADASGDLSALGRFDIVFSNAAIQWMPGHDKVLQQLFTLLEFGGVLAVQIPSTAQMPIHIALQTLSNSQKWGARLGSVTTHSTFDAAYYYHILSALTSDVELWETHYYHVMEDHHALVQWYSSTGLKPYLDALKNETDRSEFLAEFEAATTKAYPAQDSGCVLFPFTRIFFIARKT